MRGNVHRSGRDQRRLGTWTASCRWAAAETKQLLSRYHQNSDSESTLAVQLEARKQSAKLLTRCARAQLFIFSERSKFSVCPGIQTGWPNRPRPARQLPSLPLVQDLSHLLQKGWEISHNVPIAQRVQEPRSILMHVIFIHVDLVAV
jgi:hypothetical protein